MTLVFDVAALAALGYGDDFHAFVVDAWPLVEPRPMVPNWHITIIAEELATVARDCKAASESGGQGPELCVNVPPGMTKSLLASVLWPAWVWTWWPECKFISATGDERLTFKHGRLMRDLVESPWYQSLWPLKLTKRSDGELINERKGVRVAASTRGTITGHHADIRLGDDLIKEQESRGRPRAVARAMLEGVDFWFSTMETRTTGDHAAAVLFGQRLHKLDPYGRALLEGYRHIMFAMAFDPDRADRRDPRKVRGELLCEARKSAEAVAKLRKRLGPRAAGAQLDQDPHPEGGTVLSPECLGHRYSKLPAPVRQAMETGESALGLDWLTSWDFAFKGELHSDPTVGQLWCRYQATFYLIDQVRGRWKFGAAKQRVRDFTAKYSWVTTHLFEDAANASAVEDDLKKEIPGLILEPLGGGCYARCEAVSGYWEAGSVKLPEEAPWLSGDDGFVTEHECFTGSDVDTDDQVAASGLALVHWTRGAQRGGMVAALEGMV